MTTSVTHTTNWEATICLDMSDNSFHYAHCHPIPDFIKNQLMSMAKNPDLEAIQKMIDSVSRCFQHLTLHEASSEKHPDWLRDIIRKEYNDDLKILTYIETFQTISMI
jgi:hypothetical protein